MRGPRVRPPDRLTLFLPCSHLHFTYFYTRYGFGKDYLRLLLLPLPRPLLLLLLQYATIPRIERLTRDQPEPRRSLPQSRRLQLRRSVTGTAKRLLLRIHLAALMRNLANLLIFGPEWPRTAPKRQKTPARRPDRPVEAQSRPAHPAPPRASPYRPLTSSRRHHILHNPLAHRIRLGPQWEGC